MRLSLEQLRDCWEGVSRELRTINGSDAAHETAESLVAFFDGTAVTLAEDGHWLGHGGVSGGAHDVRYTFRAEGAAVESVMWILCHEPRLVVVKARNPSAAESGLAASVRRLSAHKRWIGGDHAIGPILAFLMLMLLVATVICAGVGRLRMALATLAALALAPLLVAMLGALRWVDDLFPGFQAVP